LCACVARGARRGRLRRVGHLDHRPAPRPLHSAEADVRPSRRGLPMKALSVVSLLCATVGTVQAQYSDGVIRIGVLNDQSGLYADLTGQGSVWAAKKAIDHFFNAAEGTESMQV